MHSCFLKLLVWVISVLWAHYMVFKFGNRQLWKRPVINDAAGFISPCLDRAGSDPTWWRQGPRVYHPSEMARPGIPVRPRRGARGARPINSIWVCSGSWRDYAASAELNVSRTITQILGLSILSVCGFVLARQDSYTLTLTLWSSAKQNLESWIFYENWRTIFATSNNVKSPIDHNTLCKGVGENAEFYVTCVSRQKQKDHFSIVCPTSCLACFMMWHMYSLKHCC